MSENQPQKLEENEERTMIQGEDLPKSEEKQISDEDKNEQQKNLLNSQNQGKEGRVESDEGSRHGQEKDEIEMSNNLKKHGVKTQEQVLLEVRKWKKMHDVLERKRKLEILMRQKKEQEEREREEQERKEKFEKQQEMKRQNIKKRLQEIEKRKSQRQLSLERERKKKKKSKRNGQHLPLYKQIEKQYKFHKLEEETRIKEEILRKKKEMLVDAEEIREHEKKFLEHIKERNASRVQLKKKTASKEPEEKNRRNNSEFNLWSKSSNDIIKQKEVEKYLRRKKFEQKVKKIPVYIDHEKMKQALVARDKAKNPLKYNYLSNVAALSDEKIYDQFKDFQINIDKNQLGNQYMKQACNDLFYEQSRISRNKSQSQIRGTKSEKAEYKNYLPEIRGLLKKKVDLKAPENEIEEILHRFRDNRSEQLAEFNKKSDIYETEAIKGIQNLRQAKQYDEFLGAEEAIDKFYMKSIQMKLASAQLQ